MPIVRCPKHGIPYNDGNPRGCPACWRERQGTDDEARVMRELARASRGAPAVEVLPPPAEPDDEGQPPGPWPPPVTQPPRLPTPEPTRLEALGKLLAANAVTLTVVLLGALTLVFLYVLSRPTFTEGYIPPLATSDPLPLPIEPNTPVIGGFALLGPVPPEVNPESSTLARFDFGRGSLVDALNGEVYAITLVTPERTWRGNRVGLSETQARGHLALLGPIREDTVMRAAPLPLGGYVSYRSAATLPRRRLMTEVRPPNGCFDVVVDVAPQVIGVAVRSGDTGVAVARRGASPMWVVHRVRVVSRALPGPYAGPPVCR